MLFYAVGLPTLTIGELFTSTSELIFSAPDFFVLSKTPFPCPLRVCRAFVATATILPGVDPVEPDMPPKSHCRTSIDVPT